MRMPTLEGSLIMTSYKIVFKYTPMYFTNPEGRQQEFRFPNCLKDFLSVPLSYISKVEKTLVEKKGIKINYLEVYSKDFRYFKLTFENADDCNNTFLQIQ